jgi:hypothetical protein
MNEYHKFYTGSSITVNRLVDLLKRENITPLIKDNIESGKLAGFGTSGDSVELYIQKTDQTKAKEVLEGFENES